MKTFLFMAVLLLTLLVATAGSYPQPQQWEYKTEDRCYDEKRINSLGAQGWELAGMAENNTGAWHCIFKRAR